MMQRYLAPALTLTLLSGLAAFMAGQGMGMIPLAIGVPAPSCPSACSGQRIPGCTVFTLAKGDQVFFGGNDDYIEPDSYYWVDQGAPGMFGAIWVGTPDNVQQGVNEVGLAYDANGLPRVDTNPHMERQPVLGGYADYPIQILRECATVSEVIEWAQTHRWHSYMHDQMHFADSSGDAVIISAGSDGELVFTRKPPGDGFLVSTNFNVANPSNGFGDSRYATAQAILGELLDRPGELSPADAASVLDAVHVEGGSSWTIAALLADLPNGKVYLYYFYQFDGPVVLDVAEQLQHPYAPGPLSRLFPPEVQQEAIRRFEHIQAQAGRCRLGGAGWLSLVGASLIALHLLSIGHRSERRFWLPVTLVLGPLGLLIWCLVGRGGAGEPARSGRAVLLELVGDLAPVVPAFLALLVVVILVPAAQSAGLLQLALILGLPLAFGLLLFQGPLLASLSKLGYPRLIWRRLPHALVATYLGLAGVNAIGLPLVNLGISTCPVMPLQASTVGVIWGMLVIGAVAGGLLLSLYHGWARRRGFRAWSALAAGETKLATPTWRQIWWWVPLTLAALVAAVLANQWLQALLLH